MDFGSFYPTQKNRTSSSAPPPTYITIGIPMPTHDAKKFQEQKKTNKCPQILTSPGKGPNKVLKKGELLSSCDISADSQTAYCALGLQQSSGMTRYRIITVHLVTPHTPLVPLKQSYTCKHFGYNFSLLPSFFCRSTYRTEKMLSHQWVFFYQYAKFC